MTIIGALILCGVKYRLTLRLSMANLNAYWIQAFHDLRHLQLVWENPSPHSLVLFSSRGYCFEERGPILARSSGFSTDATSTDFDVKSLK